MRYMYSRLVACCLSCRRQTHGLEMFGNTEDDDVDCLFYIYAKYITDRQEGMKAHVLLYSIEHLFYVHDCRSAVHHF